MTNKFCSIPLKFRHAQLITRFRFEWLFRDFSIKTALDCADNLGKLCASWWFTYPRRNRFILWPLIRSHRQWSFLDGGIGSLCQHLCSHHLHTRLISLDWRASSLINSRGWSGVDHRSPLSNRRLLLGQRHCRISGSWRNHTFLTNTWVLRG